MKNDKDWVSQVMLLILVTMAALIVGAVTGRCQVSASEKPELGRVSKAPPQASTIYTDKVSGAGVRIAFADAGHGNGEVTGVLGEFTLDGANVTAFNFYEGGAGTGFVSAIGALDNQLQTLNWGADWTLWSLNETSKRITRRDQDQYSVPGQDVLIPLTKRSAMFAGFGKLYPAKATAKDKLSMPANSDMMRIGSYVVVAHNASSVYIYDAYTTELVVYSRRANGLIDVASKTLVTYVANMAAMATFGNDLVVYTRHWGDANEAAYGTLSLIPNAAAGNAIQVVLDERVTGFDTNQWVGNAFVAIDDGTGQVALVTVDHQYGPNGNLDQIVVRTADGVWHKVPTPDGMYITAFAVIPPAK